MRSDPVCSERFLFVAFEIFIYEGEGVLSLQEFVALVVSLYSLGCSGTCFVRLALTLEICLSLLPHYWDFCKFNYNVLQVTQLPD